METAVFMHHPPFKTSLYYPCTRMYRNIDTSAMLIRMDEVSDFHSSIEIGNFMTKSPSFDHELDLVAVAPADTFAAYASMTYDKVNCSAKFEPICTHPNHVFVNIGDQIAANKLYEAVGFTEAHKGISGRLYTHFLQRIFTN